MVIEVSGPSEKVNQVHRLEDRNKNCKNLKAMHKLVTSKMEVPSITLTKQPRLYSVQFYNNEAFVYSLSKPCSHSYVFVENHKFNVLGKDSILAQAMPTFVKNFSAIKTLVEITQAQLDTMFSFVDETQDIMQEDNQDPSPHVSPQKPKPVSKKKKKEREKLNFFCQPNRNK